MKYKEDKIDIIIKACMVSAIIIAVATIAIGEYIL